MLRYANMRDNEKSKMSQRQPSEITLLLESWSQGDKDAVSGLYDDAIRPVAGDFDGDGLHDDVALHRIGGECRCEQPTQLPPRGVHDRLQASALCAPNGGLKGTSTARQSPASASSSV